MTLFLFLYKNKKWLNIGNEQLYRLAIDVAKSKIKSRDGIIHWLEKTLTKHLINYRN